MSLESYLSTMSGIVRTARLARRPPARLHPQSLRRTLHEPTSSAGVLLRSQVPPTLRRNRKRPWPFGTYSLHNVPAVRAISFARVLPNLAVKLLRIPALFGGAMLAGMAFLQYQATREFHGYFMDRQELTTASGRGWQLCSRRVPKNKRFS